MLWLCLPSLVFALILTLLLSFSPFVKGTFLDVHLTVYYVCKVLCWSLGVRREIGLVLLTESLLTSREKE